MFIVILSEHIGKKLFKLEGTQTNQYLILDKDKGLIYIYIYIQQQKRFGSRYLES